MKKFKLEIGIILSILIILAGVFTIYYIEYTAVKPGNCYRHAESSTISKVKYKLRGTLGDTISYNYSNGEDKYGYKFKKRLLVSFEVVYPTQVDCAYYDLQVLRNEIIYMLRSK